MPPDWKRLPDESKLAARHFASELGNHGHMIVLLDEITSAPIASTGVLPYRGKDWLGNAQRGMSDADIANRVFASAGGDGVPDWKVCCFCVDPSYRGKGLSHYLLRALEKSIKHRGAKRLYASYAEVENGSFWPRMGSEVIPDAGSTLRKGFQIDPVKEGLRADLAFSLAAKTL